LDIERKAECSDLPRNPHPPRISGGGEQRAPLGLPRGDSCTKKRLSIFSSSLPLFLSLFPFFGAGGWNMALASTDPTAAFNAANHAVKLDRFMVAAGGEPNTPSKPVKVKVG